MGILEDIKYKHYNKVDEFLTKNPQEFANYENQLCTAYTVNGDINSESVCKRLIKLHKQGLFTFEFVKNQILKSQDSESIILFHLEFPNDFRESEMIDTIDLQEIAFPERKDGGIRGNKHKRVHKLVSKIEILKELVKIVKMQDM